MPPLRKKSKPSKGGQDRDRGGTSVPTPSQAHQPSSTVSPPAQGQPAGASERGRGGGPGGTPVPTLSQAHQPSSTVSPPAQGQPAGASERGRGGGPGGTPVPTPSQAHQPSSTVPPPEPAVAPPSIAASSSSSPPLPPHPVTEYPTSEYPDRPGPGRMGRQIQVRANHFHVQVAVVDLYHYDVNITPEIKVKKVYRDVMNLLIQTHEEMTPGNCTPAYDGGKILFTTAPFPFESKEFGVELNDNDESSSSSASTSKKRGREFSVLIRFASKINLHHLHQFLRGLQLDCPHETIQALDIVLRATPSERYTVVGRSFFSPIFRNPRFLDALTKSWRGYYQSLRPTQMGLSLNIDVSARAFYDSIMVIDFIEKILKFNLEALSDQDRVMVNKALRGVKVEVRTGHVIRSYRVTGVTKDPPSLLTFTLKDKITEKFVDQYFRERYNIILERTLLPALQAGSDKDPIYLPMELCQIAPAQRYTKKLSDKQVSGLLSATCEVPKEREDSIKQIVRRHNFNKDKFVCDFGIQVKEDLTLLNARVLPPPMLQYHKSQVKPFKGQWNMIGKKMVNGGTVQHWTCVNFSGSQKGTNMPNIFCDSLVSMCCRKGMVFNKEPLIPISYKDPVEIGNALVIIDKECRTKLAEGGRLQLLIIILPDVKGSYGIIKRICETELGIVSQCCKPNQVEKATDQYFENLALKINVKVGGRNTVLIDAIASRIPHVSDKPTIILGADVTHPQPGDESSPSIAAVVASMDWPEVTKYRGIVSAQSGRKEIIQDLYKSSQDPDRGLGPGGMIRDLLCAFRNSTGHKPERIIFYRDGVSEGQFSQVLNNEIDAIRKACASLEEGDLPPPPLTFVVVQKRHHTRLFPFDHNNQDQTDKSGNIKPGTVVDTTICHPREFDFYLNTHAGIKGTSRPAHYHVLFDENKFSSDELQTLTNNLCYTYARCTRSVSIVPPAYYAHLAAFRARYYMEGESSEGGSASGSRSADFEVTLPSVKDNVKDVMFFC